MSYTYREPLVHSNEIETFNRGKKVSIKLEAHDIASLLILYILKYIELLFFY